MTKEEYQNSEQYQNYLSQIEKAIEEKVKIQESTDLTSEKKMDGIAKLSENLMDNQIKLGTFIDKKYFMKFEEGTETTINPEKIKLFLDNDENKDNYEHVFAYSFGPFKPLKYFAASKKIVVVDWEPYMLRGELEKYRTGKIPQLGGHLQAKEFSTYDKLEAQTHIVAVDFCQLLMSKFSVYKTKDEIMHDHMCILEHNYFPALAFTNNSCSEKSYMKKFAEWNKDILSSFLDFYAGDIIIGHVNMLGYLCFPYPGLLKVARQDGNKESEGESTDKLLSAYPEASITGHKITRSWFNHNLGGNGASALLDEKGKLWVGYVHFKSRRGDQWSHQDQEEMASWLHRILSGL